MPEQTDVRPHDARSHDCPFFVALRRMIHSKVIVGDAHTSIFWLLFCSQFVYLRIGNHKPRRDL